MQADPEPRDMELFRDAKGAGCQYTQSFKALWGTYGRVDYMHKCLGLNKYYRWAVTVNRGACPDVQTPHNPSPLAILTRPVRDLGKNKNKKTI